MYLASLRQALSLPAKVWAIALSIWLVVATTVLAIWISAEIDNRHKEFQAQSMALHELVRQRLDQNEAVLSGLESLFNTFPGLQFDGIRGYSREMLRRYPHIYGIELQPRVELDEVESFEAYVRDLTRQPYHLKDLRYAGKRGWRPVTKRPFYYPITFMEPAPVVASPALGLDVYADERFHEAVEKAILTGKPAVSLPMKLMEGGFAYMIFKAIYDVNPPSPASELRHKQATRLISMLIRSSKFLRQDELPSREISVLIRLKDFPASSPQGLIDKIDAIVPARSAAALLPQFVFSKNLPSDSQPFVFETRRQLGWEILQPVPLAIGLLATFALVMLGAVLYNQRLVSRLATKLTETMLAQEREKALVTLHSISDAVIALNESGCIEYMNPAAEAATRQTVRAVKGKRIDDILVLHYELSQSTVGNPFQICVQECRPVDFPDNSVIARPDGERLLVEGNVSPLFNEHRKLTGAVVVFRDMGPTRRKALESIEKSEKRLRQHQSELAHVARLSTMGEMASGIAHEINQPLAAILSYNQACIRMLQDEDANIEEIIGAMQSAAAQSTRAGEIIKRLRAFVSKQASGSVDVDLNQVVHNVLTLAEHNLRDQQVTVETELKVGLPCVSADSIQLEQVVLNLLRNAIDAMRDTPPEARNILIATTIKGDVVVFTIRDHGEGLKQDVLDKLFDPFFTTKSDGMGLGLTISMSIIETYGGKLSAGNTPGKGAVFSFELPIKERKTAA